MLQNIRITAFTFFELLRENQRKVRRGGDKIPQAGGLNAPNVFNVHEKVSAKQN